MRNPYYEGPVSDHFDGIRFLNPAGEPETDRSFGEFLRWRRSAPDNRWPSSVDVTPVTPEARVDGPRVTMVGHAQTGRAHVRTPVTNAHLVCPLLLEHNIK